MATIRPFRAIRPQRDKVHLVATRPYYSYKENVLKAKLEDNPFTFLHIINPEFNHHQKTKPNSTERFQLVKSRYEHFMATGILYKDEIPSLYLYRQTTEKNVFIGVIGGASVEEYELGLIKKHEATLTTREEMFTLYLEEVGYNAEPVLLSYEGTDELSSLMAKCQLTRPEYEFTTTDQIKHELWVLSQEQTKQIQDAFKQIPCTYIADGHHRCASSARLSKNRIDKGQEILSSSHFLAYFVEEKSLSILAFHRLVRTLAGNTKDSFMQSIRALGNLEKIKEARKPNKEHEICFYIGGEWFSLQLLDDLINKEHPVKTLDSNMLTEFVLGPILHVADLKTSDQVEFIPGNQDLSVLTNAIDEGEFAVGFVLYPLTIEQVKKVADEKMNMPPKTTYVEPKLRSGLTNYDINE